MTDLAKAFIEESRQYLEVEYLPSIERAVAGLSDEDVWWRPNEASNSIGNLVLHLTGNVREWILGGVGRLPYERNRQREFDERKAIPKDALLARLRTVLGEADAVLERVTDTDLLEVREIHGDDITVMQAIYHVVEHFSTHTGQILWIAKSRRG
jgi:uncharacterized damage-inducible protein DinB